MIGAPRNWARGVLLWNLALDQHFGPHKGGCGNCRGVVTIDSNTDAVTRNPEYYALAHASRFVMPGAWRIASDTRIDGIETVAYANPDGSRVLLAFNAGKAAADFTVQSEGRHFGYRLPAGAAATFRWRAAR
jgi:glucosylceramidase